MGVLSDLTIFDFTQGYSGAFCTMQLADFGARVIKVEMPGNGDYLRNVKPIKNGSSGYFVSVNRNKESIALDFTKIENVELIKKIIKSADILVDDYAIKALESIGLGYEEIKKINNSVIYASITSFGAADKRMDGSDNVIQAISGMNMMTGFPDKEPSKVGVSISESFSGLNCVMGILLAYLNRINSGEGQSVDVSMLDSVFSMLESPVLNDSLLGAMSTRCGNNDSETLVPYDVYKCSDGHFSVGLASDSGWDNFCEVIKKPELRDDIRFKNNELRCKNYGIITPMIAEFFTGKSRAELQEIFALANIPSAPVLSVDEVIKNSQVEHREMVVERESSQIGNYISISNPVRMNKIKAQLFKESPLLGEDTERVFLEAGIDINKK